MQPSPKPESRTYSDYETVDECMEGKKITSHLKNFFKFILINFKCYMFRDSFCIGAYLFNMHAVSCRSLGSAGVRVSSHD